MPTTEFSGYPSYPYADRDKPLTKRDIRDQKRYERWQHPVKTRLKKFGATVLTLTSLYGMDIAHGREELSHTNPSVVEVYSARSPKYADEATVVSAGWGNMTSYYTAAALPAYAERGNVWSLSYDNKGVDTGVMAKKLIDTANAEGVTKLSFSGHSMGGLVDLDVARRVYESHTPITVPYIILDCTPESIGAVRPNRRNEGYRMVEGLNLIPGARYSTALRFVVEDAVRHDQYEDASSPLMVDPVKLFKTSLNVLEDKVLNGSTASNSLLESQFMYIVASGARDDIMALGKDNGKPKPVLVFMRPENASADKTVDDDYSQKLLERDAQAAGLSLIVIKIDGTGHADPIQKRAPYNTALKTRAFPEIAAAQQAQLARAQKTVSANTQTSIADGSH